MRVAIVSDSHGVLPPSLWERMAGAERILHLGDLGPLALLADLAALAPVIAVGGNNDRVGLPELPPARALELTGLRLFLRHHPWRRGELGPPGLYLHGHVHLPRLEAFGDRVVVCPGALRMPRGGKPTSLALLETDPGPGRIEIVALATGEILDGLDLPPAITGPEAAPPR